jgi:glycosyltransferase involved in cell wall biosynthesis
VVHESQPGYGSALMGGIAAARGKYIIMGDADDSYDFGEIPGFVEGMRAGADLVMGSRFAGKILPGAMPWSHQYIGNPILTGILNLFFRSGVSDAHCGMRGFTKAAYERIGVQTTGMEFASEMVIKATQARLKITEVPITYYPRAGESKQSSLRDGWRHLRFMLMYSPTWLFFIPGAVLFLAGLVLAFVANTFPGTLAGSLLTLLGFQVVILGLYARTYVQLEHFEDHDPVMELIWRHFDLEKGILLGNALLIIGIVRITLSMGRLV